MIQEKKNKLNISRKQLLEHGIISVRSYNACGNARLDTLADILEYYERNKNFLNCKNSGKSTNSQLIQVCEDYYSGALDLERLEEEEEEAVDKKTDCRDRFAAFDRLRFELYEYTYIRELKKLDVRSFNALHSIDAQTFFDDVIRKVNYSFISLAYVGKKTVDALENFKKRIEDVIIEISDKDDETVFNENTQMKYHDIRPAKHILDFRDKHGHLPMFWILEQRLLASKDRNIQKMLQKLPVFNDSAKSRSDRSEVKRRLLNKDKIAAIQNTFYSTFGSGAKSFQYVDDWSYCYELLLDGSLFFSSEELKEKLKKEKAHFTPEMAVYILSTVFGNSVEMYGGRLATDGYWKTLFVVRKNLAEIYNFRKLKDDFRYLAKVRNDFADDNLLTVINSSEYYLGSRFSKNDKVIGIAKSFLLEEYGININEDGTHSIVR